MLRALVLAAAGRLRPVSLLSFVLLARFCRGMLGQGERPMRSMFGVGCLLLLAGAVDAQVIYRCRGADGIIAVQSAPCGPEQRDLGARYYAPLQDDPAALQRRRQVEAEMQQRHRQQSAARYSFGRPATATDTRTQQRIQCDLARRNREETLERLGTRRTFDILRSLNESVQRACKGL